MRAVVIHEHGGYDQLRFEDRPAPTPGPGQVRVSLHTAGLNHLDTWVRRGVPGHVFPLPIIPGCDGAGVVDAVGPGVDESRIGARVLIAPGFVPSDDALTVSGNDNLSPHYGIFGETTDGTCTELIAVPARNAIPIADDLSFADAAAFPLVFLTAWNMVVRRARVTPGDTVLIHAAGSGVSSAAIQIAKHVGAARILATTSTEAKADRARALGADDVIDYSDASWSKQVKALTSGRGVDVVVDHVGEATFGNSLKVLTRGGRYVFCGATTGGAVKAHLNLIFFKNLSILGSTMGSLGDLHRIVRMVERGILKPIVDDVLALDEVGKAHRRIEAREVFGKLVLLIRGDEA